MQEDSSFSGPQPWRAPERLGPSQCRESVKSVPEENKETSPYHKRVPNKSPPDTATTRGAQSITWAFWRPEGAGILRPYVWVERAWKTPLGKTKQFSRDLKTLSSFLSHFENRELMCCQFSTPSVNAGEERHRSYKTKDGSDVCI